MRVSPEEQAFAAEAMVRGLGADAPIGFAVHDDQLRFELVSDSLAAMNDLPPADHLGRRITDILPPKLATRVEGLLTGVLESGEPQTGVEITGATQAGAERTWVASFYPMPERHVGVVVVDVTDRRRTQEELRESERVLSGAQQMARLGWWTWKPDPETVVYAPELLAMMGRDPALGGAPQSRDQLVFADPGEMESVREDAHAALAGLRPFARRIRGRDANGDLRLLDARATVVRDEDGTPAGLQGFVQDVTELVRAGERERVVAELGQAALEGPDLDALMKRAIAAAEQEFDGDEAAIFELSADGTELLLHTSRRSDRLARTPLAPDSALARVLDTRQPALVDDIEADAGYRPSDTLVAGGGRSALSVVIGGRGRPFGVLGLMSRRPGRFRREDVTFAQAIANVLADAVERRAMATEIAELSAARGRLVAQALDAEERARRRMSETLHDGALQDLLAATHDLHALGDAADVVHVRERLLAIVRRLREVMSAMHPTVLQYGGLEAALQAVAEQHGYEPRLAVDEDAVGVHDELLLSVARELLENAARHSQASTVGVAVRREDGNVVLEVADDGIGFDPEDAERARAEGAIGLASCRERLEALGGGLSVASTPGDGTHARATAPDRTARISG